MKLFLVKTSSNVDPGTYAPVAQREEPARGRDVDVEAGGARPKRGACCSSP